MIENTLLVGDILFPTNLGKCSVVIKTCNDDIAYFHIINENDIDIKIQLFSSEYYGNNDYLLSNIEKNILMNFMLDNKTNRDDLFIDPWQNWKSAVFCWVSENDWYSNYPQKNHIKDYSIPNYLNL